MKQKHVVKAILSVILTMAMIFGTVQLPFAPGIEVAHAEPTIVASGNCGASTNDGGESSVTWTLDSDGKLTISGSGAMAMNFVGSSEVPWNTYHSVITSVEIDDRVTSIGNSAFSYCSGLTTITIPDSVTSIGPSAFYDCDGLTTITIPDSVTSIGSYAFDRCSALQTVYAPAVLDLSYCEIREEATIIKYKALGTCGASTNEGGVDSVRWVLDNTGKLTISGTGAMADYSDTDALWYSSRASITSAVIENGVTSIGNSAFYECRELTTITIPNSVTSIGEDVFWGCSGLTTITIPDSVTSIGRYAFWNCRGLTTIIIPDSVTSIGSYALGDCPALQTVYALVGLDLSNCNISEEATIIGYYVVKLAPTEHGTVTVSGGTGVPNCEAYFTDESENRTATLNITPDDGYTLDTLTVKDASDNLIPVTNSSFTMPADKHVTINATFRGSNDDAVYPASDDNTLSGWITRTVSIADKATVTLSNATISGGIICEGDATIILAGENTVTAPDYHAGIYVPQNKTLTVNGDGKLNVTGGENGAGIGGYGIDYIDCHSCGNIIINSGEVTATGGDRGAGIGGGHLSDCGNITINGGTVKATGGQGSAGIGGANNACFGNIRIAGGDVTALGASGAAGIGGCAYCGSTGGNITISGGKVNATGGEYAAGIGCGEDGNCGDILIEGGEIEAYGGEASAGIGGANPASHDIECGVITIKDSIISLIAKPGTNWNIAIGKGEDISTEQSICGTVTIGDKVFANNEIIGNPFTTKPCMITFAAGDGEGTMDSVKFMENLDYKLPACGFTATTGKMFKEWSVTTGNAGAVTKAAGESVKITGDTVVTAVWKEGTRTDIPVAASNLIYNGKEQTGVVSGEGYTVTGNTALNAGTYKATAKLQDGYIWSDVTTTDKVIEWSIAKATPSYEAPTGLKATTGQTLANVTLPDGWAWADKTLSVGNAGTNVFKATYTPADTTNYNAVENIELSVTVSKATSNTNGGSTSPGGGSTSGSGNTSGGGGSSSGNTDNKDNTEKTTTPVTEKTTNADGSVTEKTTTTNTDGSKTETSKTTAKDGTVTEAEKTTAKDGTVKETEKTTAKDGTVTETQKTTSTDGTVTESEKTTLTDGSVKEVEKTTSTDGTIVEKTAETDKDGSAVVTEKVTDKDGSSSETTVTVDSNGKAKSIVATDSDGKKDSQTVAFEVKGNKATVSSIDTSTGKVTIPETIDAPDGKTYTVTNLDKDAFDGQKLKELSLPETIKVINPKALENTGLKTLNLTGKNTKLKKSCLKNTNKNLVIKVTTKAEKRNIEKQLKKAGNPNAKVKVSKKKA